MAQRSSTLSSNYESMTSGKTMVSLNTFHRTAGFWGFYLIVMFCLIRLMLMLQSILLPFLWAFFVCMTLHPFVDLTEDLMVFSWSFFVAFISGFGYHGAIEEAWDVADQPRDEMGDRLDRRFRHVKFFAALFVLFSTIGTAFLFGYLVYINVYDVIEKQDHYIKGAHKFGHILADAIREANISFVTPKQIEEIENGNILDWDYIYDKAVEWFVTSGIHMIFLLILTAIYIVFWLFGPIPLDPSVRQVFQRYILIKTSVSFCYAASVYALLTLFDVDLRIAFALLTFLLNFVPEIGAIMCIVLPLPVILFDGNLENPLEKATFVLVGELLLKLIYGNIVEVIVLESDAQMRMHPVVILLCIAFFGWIWGPTGMLLSVPIMAALKATIASSAIPEKYRDPILVAIEGDTHAPQRFDEMPRTSAVSMGFSPFKEARKAPRKSVVSTSMPRNSMIGGPMGRRQSMASSAFREGGLNDSNTMGGPGMPRKSQVINSSNFSRDPP